MIFNKDIQLSKTIALSDPTHMISDEMSLYACWKHTSLCQNKCQTHQFEDSIEN